LNPTHPAPETGASRNGATVAAHDVGLFQAEQGIHVVGHRFEGLKVYADHAPSPAGS
jgi:hypothetical protein